MTHPGASFQGKGEQCSKYLQCILDEGSACSVLDEHNLETNLLTSEKLKTVPRIRIGYLIFDLYKQK